MKVTIVPEDKLVLVGGVALDGIDMSSIPSDVHAIQWDGSAGEIEYNDDKLNEPITSIAAYQDVIDAWTAKQAFADALDADPYHGMTPEEKAAAVKAEADNVDRGLALDMVIEEKLASVKWDASKQYSIGDIVIHDGKKWEATSNNTGNVPDNVPGDWVETD